MPRILIAEDDESLSAMILDKLVAIGYAVERTANGTDALALAQSYEFDLLILDWNLPGLSGLEICREIRAKRRTDPILFLTAKTDIADKETGLDSGADDYLTKPFDMRELTARVRSLLRRSPQYVGDVVRFADVTLDRESGQLRNNEKQVHLKPREASLLEFFIRRSGHVLNSEVLLSGVWGTEFDGTEIALRSCLAKLRKALAQLGYEDVIETVHGFGYRFKAPND
jgi:DNA-binding response OmpR family regulator